MATQEKLPLDQAAEELEGLVKSLHPEPAPPQIEEELTKSAAAQDPAADDEHEEDEEPMAQSHGRTQTSSPAETMHKSLADSEAYQEVIDVTEALGVLGDATVHGLRSMEKSVGGLDTRVAVIEKHQRLLMRGVAELIKLARDATPLRKPMLGQFGGFQKSASPANGTTLKENAGFTVSQLDRAAMILLEEGKLPTGSGAF